MQAKMRKSLWRGTGSMSPISFSVSEPPSSSPDSDSSVSVVARLISSSSTQSPFRTAFTSVPSTKENAKLFRTFCSRCCTSNLLTTPRSFSHPARSPGPIGFLLGAPSAVIVVVVAVVASASAARRLSTRARVRWTRETNLGQSCWAKAVLRDARNSVLDLRENVFTNRVSKRSLMGVQSRRSSTGLKPPMRSALSVCWLRFCTTSVRPICAARCCTTVVFPVPVSPTSSTGSFRDTHSAICSSNLNVFPVCANGCCCCCGGGGGIPVIAAAVRLPFLGRVTRPTVKVVGLSEWTSGLRRSQRQVTLSGKMPHTSAMTSARSLRALWCETAAQKQSIASRKITSSMSDDTGAPTVATTALSPQNVATRCAHFITSRALGVRDSALGGMYPLSLTIVLLFPSPLLELLLL